MENELLEHSLKREAAQQLFETEQYNRLLVEELQAEEELNKIILLKAYLERLKAYESLKSNNCYFPLM